MAAAQELVVESTEELIDTSGRFRDALSLLYANKAGLFGLVVTVIVLVIGCVGALLLAVPSLHHLYLDQNLSEALFAPGVGGHALGTDEYGRDLLWRTIAGAGISLLVAVITTSFTLVLGLTLGSIAGYFGGKFDTCIAALIDLTWGFPLLLVAVVFAGMLGPGLRPVILAIGVVIWAGFARVVRAQVRSMREREFVEAARALGTPAHTIIIRHMLPNIMGTVLVMASYYVAVSVIAEAAFSFIGLGAQPPTPSLGQMIADGTNYFNTSFWPAVVPGVMIALIVLGLNLLGDGLRDIFDPRLKRL
jgi:peptide/nickel transport system permease protein